MDSVCFRMVFANCESADPAPGAYGVAILLRLSVTGLLQMDPINPTDEIQRFPSSKPLKNAKTQGTVSQTGDFLSAPRLCWKPAFMFVKRATITGGPKVRPKRDGFVGRQNKLVKDQKNPEEK